MAYEPAAQIDYSGYTALKLTLDDGIMEVALYNPARRNAVTPTMSVELARIWEDVWADPNVAVVILTGDGDSFCSGADLSMLAASGDEPAEEPPAYLNATSRIARKHVMSLLECEKPVLCKLRGPAYGLGATLAVACDMVFAAPSAKICDSHVKAGMVAGDGGVLLWPLAIGFHQAKRYLMTGDPIPADVAERIGLINEVVPDEELDAHVLAMARKLRDLPPHAVNYTKASLNMALKQMAGPAFETSLAYEIYTMQMQDHQEAMRAFGERRKGVFKGR